MKKETAKDGLCTDVPPPSEKNRGSGDVCTQAKLRNDLPVTGDRSLPETYVMGTEFWDRQEANIASR